MIEHDNRAKYMYFFSLFVGMLVGCIIFFTLLEAAPVDPMGNDFLKQLKRDGLNISDLNLYICRQRIKQLLLFMGCSYLLSYSVSAILFSFVIGMYYGMVYCGMYLQYGLKGILYTCLLFFPQYVLYFFCICYTAIIMKQYNQELLYCGKKSNKLKIIINVFVIIMLFVMGLLWEIFFQKNFLQYFTNI